MDATTTVARAARAAPRLQPDRMLVPDVLRGVAIVAMLIAHALPLVPGLRGGAVGFVAGNVNDLASPLFALVMGMSAALVLARPTSSGGRVVVQNLIRGAVLVALGVWLGTWGSWIAIVLAHLGLTLALGTPILLLRSRAVAVIGAVLLVLGAPLNAAVAAGADPTVLYGRTPVGLLLQWSFVDPHYRVTNLLPFFLLGALLLRRGFRRERLLVLLAVVAVLAYPVRPVLERLLGVDAGSGSHPDTLHDLGLVLAAYVVVVLLATVRRRPASTVIAAALTPLRAVGSLALSVYVLQVAVVAAFATAGLGYRADTPAAALLLVLGVWAIGVLWWRFVGIGPLEWLIGRLTRLVPGPRR
ncbi:DUF418 domain-containing protein [Rathayibacter sp. VKM Ac-2856]|uniref:DUF418 domain-containing protein n=1 Tax=unclassified Rathayibacter TaxID=2609250 RepID=UPI001565D061|nr:MULTISPECIES: DUF418 domain-containing protein [unclassified Rathayibacter]NQX05455.1 DUF418 domain-containing protein [Rathayibacter sp. VKM Ac-2858]NQX20670.1 DUF418 domain-containing protein [Rathayibacter sp. VKM Ac-2856]